MADEPEIAGPPEPRSRYDNIPAAPRRKPPEESGFQTLRDVILPILVAQALDFASTEEPIGFLRRDDMAEYMNRFPGARAEGFAGTAGRMASGGAELLLAALLSKASPKLGRAYATPSISTHADLARGNMEMASEKDRRDLSQRLVSRGR